MKKLTTILAMGFLITSVNARSVSVGTDVGSTYLDNKDVYVSYGDDFIPRFLSYSINLKAYTDGSNDFSVSPTLTGSLPLGNLTPYLGYSIKRRLNDKTNTWTDNVFAGAKVKLNEQFYAHAEIDYLTKPKKEYEAGVSAKLTKAVSVGINNDWCTKINDDSMSVQLTYNF